MQVLKKCPICGSYMVQEFVWQAGMPVYRFRCVNSSCNNIIDGSTSTSNNKTTGCRLKPSSTNTSNLK